VQINVTDLDAAWQFYVETLGLPGKQKLGPGRAFELELGNSGPTVLVYPVPQQAKRNYPNETGVTLVFYTDDIRSTVADWKAKGVAFVPIEWSQEEIGIADTPFGPFIAFQDPFGNVHELLEPVGQPPTQSTAAPPMPMIEQPASSAPKLKDVFVGFPQSLVPERVLQKLIRYALALDTLGRLDAETGKPLVDEHTLRAVLLEFVAAPLAERLVHLLATLPGCAFRPAHQVGTPAVEIPFFGLAGEVVIFDPSPLATFGELKIPTQPQVDDVVAAVRDRFPSLEDELLKPDQIPPRIEALLKEDSSVDVVLGVICRQLGWWAALMAVLLVPPTVLLRSKARKREEPNLLANVWPLSMYLLTAAVGGWTLTVVGSCILAPVDSAERHAKH
jgi:catechol 2,3-dioxygenase-like lactoylglutathione lyase family enzyme